MPVYNTPQSGGYGPPDQGLNLTCVIPGESFVLFDGSETPAVDLTSVAFVRGPSPTFADGGMTFQVTGFGDPGDTVDIQCSNVDSDGDYATVATLDETNPVYTDVGRSAFYRAKISALVSSPAVTPVVTVQR